MESAYSFNSKKINKEVKMEENNDSNFKNYKDKILLELLKQYIDKGENNLNEKKSISSNSQEDFEKNISIKKQSIHHSFQKDNVNAVNPSPFHFFPNLRGFNNFSFEMLINCNNPQIFGFFIYFMYLKNKKKYRSDKIYARCI